MPQVQWEQHQPVSLSSSAQIMRLDIHIPLDVVFEQALPLGGEGRQLERWSAESEPMPFAIIL
jgi:hypothetical protein